MANKYLNQFLPLVDAIANTFGKNCEVVLHDLRKPEKSIVKIANGHVTGREIGGPITDLVLSLLENKRIKSESLVGYKTITKKGSELRSTTIFLKNEKGKVVGALCINLDITPYISVKSVFDELCLPLIQINGTGPKESPEKFESNVDTLIKEMIEQSRKRIGKAFLHMRKEDKLNMIRDLKSKGLFLIRGSAKKIAKELNVSLPTIYKYLEEIQEV